MKEKKTQPLTSRYLSASKEDRLANHKVAHKQLETCLVDRERLPTRTCDSLSGAVGTEGRQANHGELPEEGAPKVALRRCVGVWPGRDGREGPPRAKGRE